MRPLICTTTLGQREPGSNSNKGVTPHSSRSEASPPEAV